MMIMMIMVKEEEGEKEVSNNDLVSWRSFLIMNHGCSSRNMSYQYHESWMIIKS